MIPKKEGFNLVMLGSWNPSVFNEDWILQNLIEDKSTPLTIAFPLDDPTAARKITFDGIDLFPGRKQVLLSPKDTTLEGLQKCSKVLLKIITLLAHTPVRQFGVNFNFIEDNNFSKIDSVFNFSDKTEIEKGELKLEESRVARKFLLPEGHSLNLTLADLNSVVEIGFNFHYEINDLSKYIELFSGSYLSDQHETALDVCKNYYGIELEEDDQNGI